jgi:hypothetical protein
MARDDNMSSVAEITDSLKSDGLVEEIDTYDYALRSDFEARHGLRRSHGIIACIRRKRDGRGKPVTGGGSGHSRTR